MTSNDLHVLWTQFLDAAQKIHVTICLLPDDAGRIQSELNAAMHCVLIGAEQCRQLHANEKMTVADADTGSRFGPDTYLRNPR